MELTTFLNPCYRCRGFVCEYARFGTDKKSIELVLRPRKDLAAVTLSRVTADPRRFMTPA
jgi:hypothetical protein